MKLYKRTLNKFKNNPFFIGFIMFLVFILFIIGVNFFNPLVSASSRPQLCDDSGCIPNEVFRQLPVYPQDLERVKLDFMNERSETYKAFLEGKMGEEYWRQPEFYPTFRENMDKYTLLSGKNIQFDYLAQCCYGAYPGDLVIREYQGTNIRVGDTIQTVTFIKAGWGVVKYQGFKLEETYPSYAKLSNYYEINQNPEEVKNYFDVEVSPNIILLEPAYFVFYKGWTEKIILTIHVKEGTPPGQYVIGLRSNEIDFDTRYQWYLKYGNAIRMTPLEYELYHVMIEVSP